MKKTITTATILALSMIAGCAHDSREISASYSSPLKYNGLNC